MRILTCHNFYQQTGGEDLSYRDEVNLLREFGHDVVEYTRHNSEISNRSRWQVFREALGNRKSFDDVSRMIRSFRPDIVHCTNTLPLISTSVYDAAQEQDVPVVQALRNFRMFCAESSCMRGKQACHACLGKKFAWRAIWHRCYRNSVGSSATIALLQSSARRQNFFEGKVSAFYTLSNFARQRLIQHGVPGDRLHVKPNFIFNPPPPGSGRGKYVIYAGRLAEVKGLRVLLSAWQGLNIPLKIVGTGPLEDFVRSQARQNANIEWLGERPLNEVYQLIGNARFLVFPSVGSETFGRTMMEAFALGTPIIAARKNAVTEIVDEFNNGFTYDPLNAAELRQVVSQLYEPELQYDRLRTQARQSFDEHYTAGKNHQVLMDIYQDAQRTHEESSSQGLSSERRIRRLKPIPFS